MSKKSGPVTVCVINLKGGVGKSTVTSLLSRHAVLSRNLDVLAIDLDPQANLSQGLLQQRYAGFLQGKRGSIVEVFQDYVPPKAGKGASALTAEAVTEVVLDRGDRSLDLIPSRFDFSDALTDAIRPDPRILAKFLSTNFKDKDLVLIDCSPTESIFTQAAYHASDFVLIPVRPEYFATIGFPLLNESMENFKTRNKANDLSVLGVIINNAFYDGGNDGGPEKARAMIEIQKGCKKNGWDIFGTPMYHSRGYPKLMRGDYSYSGDARYFWGLADEIIKKAGLWA